MKRILVSGLSVDIGGIGTLVTNVVSYNKRIGNSQEFVFEFLIPYQSVYRTWFQQEHYTYYEIPSLKQWFRYRTFLRQFFRKRHYDYVWINNTSKVDIWLPWIAKHIGGAKIIQHAHGTDCEEKGIRRLIFKLCECLWGKAYEKLIDIPLACSSLSADYFYRCPVLREKCTVLHNGINVDQFKFNESVRFTTRQALGLTDENILLGAVGRLTKVKNYPFLIDLMKHLPQSHHCIIIGDGEDKDLLEKQIDGLKLQDRVQLLGQRRDIPDLLCAMDILVMPSLNEGLPFSLIEAQASGLRCVCSEGIPKEADLLKHVHFINLSSMTEWVKTCGEKSNEPFDRILCNRMVKQAGYSIETSYDNFIRLLE